MSKVNIVFWTGSGNTETMANYIADGVKNVGAEASLVQVSHASVDELKNATAFALGCPAMGAEVLEETEMEPFMCELEKEISGKQVVLFGSYGWGDGEWMRNWEARISAAGATVVAGAGIIANGEPDNEAKEKCVNAGSELARLI